jgi:metal-sulfur cluster biosynthetic enzyme
MGYNNVNVKWVMDTPWKTMKIREDGSHVLDCKKQDPVQKMLQNIEKCVSPCIH